MDRQIYKTIVNYFIISILLIFCNTHPLYCQEENNLIFSKRVHNFGKISVKAGEQKCAFSYINKSNKPIVIYNILSSCGCTTPEWSKKPIMPNESGEIKVTYLNDQGAIPFDKALTIYTSAAEKPIVLRITGVVVDGSQKMESLFPHKIGCIGFKKPIIRFGQLAQGESKGSEISIANLSNKPIKVSVVPRSAALTASITPSTIEAEHIADFVYNINTNAKRYWGNQIFTADLYIDGVKQSKPIEIECMILDNFKNYTQDMIKEAPLVIASSSTYNFGTVKKGEKIKAIFNLKNTGNNKLIIHKIDDNNHNLTIKYPKEITHRDIFNIEVDIDTNLYKGEVVLTITLITNSPSRPLVNLFITGIIN